MNTKFWLGKVKVLSVGVVLLVAGCQAVTVKYCKDGTNTCSYDEKEDLGGIPVYFNVPVRYQYSVYSAYLMNFVVKCDKTEYEFDNVFYNKSILNLNTKTDWDKYYATSEKNREVVSKENYAILKNYEEMKGIPDVSRVYIINTPDKLIGTAALKVEVNSDGTFKSTDASVTATSANTVAGLASTLAAAYLAKAWKLEDAAKNLAGTTSGVPDAPVSSPAPATDKCVVKVTKTQTVVVTLRKKLGDSKFDSTKPLTYELSNTKDGEVELVSTEISSASSSKEKETTESGPATSEK